MGNNDASLVEPVDNLRPLDEDGVEVIVKPENMERSDNSKSSSTIVSAQRRNGETGLLNARLQLHC